VIFNLHNNNSNHMYISCHISWTKSCTC